MPCHGEAMAEHMLSVTVRGLNSLKENPVIRKCSGTGEKTAET